MRLRFLDGQDGGQGGYALPPRNPFASVRGLSIAVVVLSAAWTGTLWLAALLAPGGALIGIAAWILTCVWLQQARGNALIVRPDGQRRSSAWVWLGWFVPIVSFWYPLQIVEDTRTATSQAAGRGRGDHLAFWWSTWIATLAGSRLAGLLAAEDGGPEPAADLALSVVATVSLAFWIRIVRQVSATQEVLATRSPVGAPAWEQPQVKGVGFGVKVEIWSDVVCPWCYVGKRRFEAALGRFEHGGDVEVEWRSFELDPSAAPSTARGEGQAELLASKYGRTLEQAQEMLDSMTATAAAEGLHYRFDIMRGGNSFDAHRLLHLAKERGGYGLQDALKERFDRGTFTEGLSVSDHDELTKVAVEAGLDEAEVRAVLGSDRYADAVRGDQEQARAHGISGVPFFVLDGRYGVSGAQPADHILAALEQAWSTR